jgi:UDP-N-acetylmuramate--alanine ligase
VAFAGIGRRFQINALSPVEGGDVLFVDDYAHHPREIAATLEAAREGWPDRRLVVVFQPHRYTRTHDLLEDFAAALSEIEHLFVTEVYSAGETPVSGADGRALCRSIRARGRHPVFVESLADLPRILAPVVGANDLVLTLGAGNIGQAALTLPGALKGVR